MKPGPLLFRITGIVVFIQLLLGGLLTFDFIGAISHIITGFIVFVLAVGTMIVVLVSKPVFQPLRGLSIGLVALIVVQIIIGFETLRTGSSTLAWIHFAVAMGIYGMVISGTFMAMRWDQMAKGSTAQMQRD
jgi:heme A synthase